LISRVPGGYPDPCAARARRAVADVAAVGLAVVAIAGCGGGGEAGTTTSATTSASPGTRATSQPTTVTTGTTTGTRGGPGDRERARQLSVPTVINAVLTTADPKKACGSDYVTAHYLSAAYGSRQGCMKAQVPGSAAQWLRFEDVVTGRQPRRLHEQVISKGGVYDGQRLEITLVRVDGEWKVDQLKSNAPVGP